METRFSAALRKMASTLRQCETIQDGLSVISNLEGFRAKYGWIDTAIKNTRKGRFKEAADCLRFLAQRVEVNTDKVREIMGPRRGKTARKPAGYDAARRARQLARGEESVSKKGGFSRKK